MEPPTSKPDSFHPDPEIIPPDRTGAPRSRGDAPIWISITDGSGRRAYKAPGPFTAIMLVVALILVVALVLMLVLGALLIWIPVVAIVATGFLVMGYLRARFQRRR